MKQENIRNFCIISHIDHGKSTLADRMLELTHAIESRKMKDQFLDSMELERERGITIKMQPVTMSYEKGGEDYILNLIDTPGHIDFEYEVSRSLKAVEGVVLLVDASQGIQAQTIDVLNKAQKEGLKIIPVVNKVDLDHAQPEDVAQQIIELINCSDDDIIFASGKTGQGVKEILDTIVDNFPCPRGDRRHRLQALIFDSTYDPHLGVIAHIRVFNGEMSPVDNLYYYATQASAQAKQVGVLMPKMIKRDKLSAGEIGYLVTGLKDIQKVLIGDTISSFATPLPKNLKTLIGFKKVQPKVFVSLYPSTGDKFPALSQAIAKIALEDSSLSWQMENSPAFGRGLRCGFLGMLHAEIIQERLEREFNLSLIATSPSVQFEIKDQKNNQFFTTDPSQMPDPGQIKWVKEPYIELEIISPNDYLSKIMDMMKKERAKYLRTDKNRIYYQMPLRRIIIDFADNIKSLSQGYASFSYKIIGFKKSDLVRLDILLAGDKVKPFTRLVEKDQAQAIGRSLTKKLKKIIPKQNFQVSIQAAIGKEIVAREDLSAFKKDVTGHLYGGDRTRKDKLLKKQAKGKKKMKLLGKVNLPTNIFRKVLEK